VSFKKFGKGILDGLEEINSGGKESTDSAGNGLAAASGQAVFDYDQVDEDTALFLQEKANRIMEVRIKSVLIIGKELSETFDKLSKVEYGERTKIFEKWVESIGISSRHARRYIDAYEYVVKNFHNIDIADKIQPSLLFEISRPSANKELQQAVLSGDITSIKQYKEMEEKLKIISSHRDLALEERDRAYGEKIELEKRMKQELEEKDVKLRELEQRLEQAKKNGDAGKVKELGEIISHKQHEAEGYRQKIRELNAQMEDLRRQLREKPIEVRAVKTEGAAEHDIKKAELKALVRRYFSETVAIAARVEEFMAKYLALPEDVENDIKNAKDKLADLLDMR